MTNRIELSEQYGEIYGETCVWWRYAMGYGPFFEGAMIDPIDALAADYIVTIWGKRRRDYARRYWMFRTRGTKRPLLAEVFASERIERHLNKLMDKVDCRIEDWTDNDGEVL